jgi:hypothetical protein
MLRGNELPRTPYRNCPKRGMSNAPTVKLAGMRSTKSAKKELLGTLQGFSTGTSETFRTVSKRSSQNSVRAKFAEIRFPDVK